MRGIRSRTFLRNVVDAITGCSALALGIGSASAQDRDTYGSSVTSRENSRLREEGLRAGSFLVMPQISADLVYNDNIQASNANAASDGIATIRPELTVESDWNNHLVKLDGFYQRAAYFENSTEDVSEFGTAFNGRLDIARQTRLSAILDYNRTAERRGDLGSFRATVERVQFSTLGGTLRLDQTLGDLVLRAEGRARQWRYDDALLQNGSVLDQKFRDFKVVSGSVQAGFNVSPITQFFARATIEARRYDLRRGDIGFDPLTQIDRSADSVRLELGVQREITQLLLANVRIGYLNFRYPDPTVRDFKVLAYAATVRWNVTPLTSIYLDGERSVDETVSPTTAGNLRDEVRLRVDHELLRNLVLTARARLGWIKPSLAAAAAGTAVSRNREREFLFEPRFYMTSRLRLHFNLRHQARTSSNAGQSFKANSVTLGFNYAI